MRRIRLLLAATLVAATAGVALGAPRTAAGGHSVCPASNRPNMLVIVGGSTQTAQLGKPFQTNLQVALANSNGCPLTGLLGGIAVDFVAPAGGASGTFAGSGSYAASVGTDAGGVATAPTFTANDSAGSYTVHASSDYGSATFSLANTASGVAAGIAAAGPTSQEAAVNSQYAQSLQAVVVDANGHGVQGVTVIFAISSGVYGASATFLSGGAQASALTKANGLATSPPFVANNSPGRFTAAASTAELSSVASYTLANHAATNTLSRGVAATGAEDDATQTTTVGTRYAQALTVRLLDPSGQPIEGAPVSFALNQGSNGAGASFLGGSNQATVLTDVSGQATSPSFVANTTPGVFTAAASVAGVTDPAAFPLRNLPANLSPTSALQTATVTKRYTRPLEARLTDALGQPIQGITVTFSVAKADNGAGASFPDGTTQATATSDSTGLASSPPLVANSTAGEFTAAATTTSANKPLGYRMRNAAGRPAKVISGAADDQTTPAGRPFPILLAVTVSDANGNPVAGARVTFAAPSRGASGSFALAGRNGQAARRTRTVKVETNAKGIAIAPRFKANAKPGGYVVTATVAHSGKRAAFALVNEQPAA